MANANTMTKISTVTVGSGGAATIDFTSIPATYTDIVIKYSGRSTAAGNYQNVNIKINTDTGSNYTSKLLYGDGSAAGSDTTTTTFLKFMYIPFSSATASVFGSGELYFAKYAGSIYKSMIADTVTENNATGSGSSIIGLAAGLWSDNSAINAITLTPNSGSWAEHSTASLYGIKATTATTALATGGTITYNGGYVYHTFLNSGTFTPAQSLITDCLVIAGGGSGGTDNTGNAGGGGAGGLTYFSSITTGASAFTVTVGAGGTAPASGDNIGIQGSSSSFSGTGITTITSTGGGGGAPYSPSTGGSGGSGGGAGQSSAGTGGSPTLNQGFAGGDTTGFRCGAGGGGAGGVGSTGTVSVPGNGGVGSSAFSPWGYATSTGVSSSGIYYYAGGGGGASHSSIGGGTPAQGGAGGGGNGARTSSNVPTAGTANSGSGGGGGGDGSGAHTGGNGGKGIIIIRYQVQ